MVKRTVSGILLIGIIVGIFFLREVSVFFFDGAIMIVLGLSVYELIRLFKEDLTISSIVVVCLYALSIYPIFYFYDVFGIFVLTVVFFALFNIVGLFDEKMSMNSLLKFMFMAVYPATLVALALPLNHSEHGLVLLAAMIAVSVFTDTMALAFGMLIGGKKLCPKISPKKTIAGAVGGLVGGIGGAIAIYFLLNKFITFSFAIGNLWVFIILGAIASIMTQFGDLIASNLKRKTGIKDFGRLIPGHGGIIDRIDGIMFSILTFYLFLLFFL